MRVKTWVEFAQEVDVEVSIAEVMSSIDSLAEDDRPHMVLDCVSRVYGVLKNVSDAQIEAMNEAQRRTIGDGFRAQAERFAPSVPLTADHVPKHSDRIESTP